MEQLVTRLGECLHITPINLISRFTFHKEESVSIMTVYLKNGEFFEADEVLVDTNLTSNVSHIAKFYGKSTTYMDYRNFMHELGFKNVGDYTSSIASYLFNN